jgi:hypothetical protein
MLAILEINQIHKTIHEVRARCGRTIIVLVDSFLSDGRIFV